MKSNRKAALGFIFITIFIDTAGIGLIIPVLPKLITELIGGDTPDAARYGSYLLSVYACMQFIFSPIVGGLSDRFGRRPLLLGSLIGLGADYIFMSLAPYISWLFVGRFFAGIMGASISTGYAYIADVSPPEKRAQNFGLVGAAFGFGFMAGPAIGGILGTYGLRVPFVAAAILSLINALYGYFILPESLKPKNRRPFDIRRANPIGSLKVLKNYPQLFGLAIALFLIYVAHHSVQNTWAYYVVEKFGWDTQLIGYSLGTVGLVSIMIQGGLIRWVIPTFGTIKCLFGGLVLYLLGNLLFAFSTTTWMMFVFIIPYCLGYIAMPSFQGILSNQIPANAQGELQGTLNSLTSLASIIGPIVMNQLFYMFSHDKAIIYFPGAHLILGAFLALLSIIIAAIVLARRKA